MATDQEIDALLEAYCEGLYAMDPRTTYPFWDYDFAPLFSKEWMVKIVTAVQRASLSDLESSDYLRLFTGPSVPRKELIYSLVDMKVARLDRHARMQLVDFWLAILKTFCGQDWLSDGSNRTFALDDVDAILSSNYWQEGDPESGKAIGSLTAALNALSYSLYSDVFVHQCAECRGPYDVSRYQGGHPHEMLIRSWSGLQPSEIWKDFQGPGFRQLKIAAIYEDISFHVDIYNHVSWKGIAPRQMRMYCLWIDGCLHPLDTQGLLHLANAVADVADKQFRVYQSIGFEERKLLWVRQRNYQFKDFFTRVGLSWQAPEMEEVVKEAALLHEPFWDMSLPKRRLFHFLRLCLDPRRDYYYDEWQNLFFAEFGDATKRRV
jgi:hypothetical protein